MPQYFDAHISNLSSFLKIVTFINLTAIFSSILKLRSSGILKRLELIASKKDREEEILFVHMDILAVAPIFAIVGIGTAAAVVILFIEVILYQRSRSKLNVQQGSEIVSRKYVTSISMCKRRFATKTVK